MPAILAEMHKTCRSLVGGGLGTEVVMTLGESLQSKTKRMRVILSSRLLGGGGAFELDGGCLFG